MITIICSFIIIVLLTGLIIRYYQRKNDPEGVLVAAFAVPGILALLALVPLHCIEGLYRGYSVGERTGYITKIAEKGIIWKTWEGQMQVGTGEMAALQQPFEFTIRRDQQDLYRQAAEFSNKRVTVKYVQWLIMPKWAGDSGYEITAIIQEGQPR